MFFGGQLLKVGAIAAQLTVARRKYTTKKHKTWDGDGVLHVEGGYAHLQDISGRDMGKIACNEPLLPGCFLSIGGKEIEVDSILLKQDYLAAVPFLNTTAVMSPPTKIPSLPQMQPKPQLSMLAEKERGKSQIQKFAAPRSLGTPAAFKTPLLANTIISKKEARNPTPRHDPFAKGAIVMKRPSATSQGKQIVDVVIDPLLTKSLRKHQREGVKFLYECVMGMRDFNGSGAILADEMGLGKTLQTIALLWTLLMQNPIDGDPPVIKKALIVCPVTLINNWRKEFSKWLGRDRLGVFIFDDNKKRITDFTKGRAYKVMVVGYEKLRSVSEDLKKGHGIDIVIADEGHRLKTAKNKSALAIRSLDTPRRVILSGTPIQNDLSEFFMMVDFVNPDLLGSYKIFTKEFETPIVKGRQPGALKKDVEKGEARNEELTSLTRPFILRRSADLLAKYLPPKTEYVLMCRPTPIQASIYQHVLACPAIQSALGSSETSLQLITILKKVCNSPWLLNPKRSTGKPTEANPLTSTLLASIPPDLMLTNQASAKLRALDQLLYILKTTTAEKIVLISNYTSTLEILEMLLTSLSYPHLRLDGSTPSAKRQSLVDDFNRSSASQCFAFLLSAKAGGMGLNLIGASRLVLFDIDWNPATDFQAMARIHRDGQKRPCIIYRLLMAGGLDEKIWQRQVTKLGLASNVMDQTGGTSSFSREELRDLFRLDEGLACQTHELIGCKCEGLGLPDILNGYEGHTETLDTEDNVAEEECLLDSPKLIQANKLDMEVQEKEIKEAKQRRSSSSKEKASAMEPLMAYSHVDTSKFALQPSEDMEALINDDVLLKVLKEDENRISFLFAKTSI